MVHLEIYMQPELVNTGRGKHRMAQAGHTSKWRSKADEIARQSGFGLFSSPVGITVLHTTGARSGRMPDCGSCFPSAKAAIDGFVDAGILSEDGPKFVHWVKFLAPQRGEDHKLEFWIESV